MRPFIARSALPPRPAAGPADRWGHSPLPRSTGRSTLAFAYDATRSPPAARAPPLPAPQATKTGSINVAFPPPLSRSHGSRHLQSGAPRSILIPFPEPKRGRTGFDPVLKVQAACRGRPVGLFKTSGQKNNCQLRRSGSRGLIDRDVPVQTPAKAGSDDSRLAPPAVRPRRRGEFDFVAARVEVPRRPGAETRNLTAG